MPSSRQMSFTATPCSARFRAPMICSSLYLLLRMMTSWSRPPSCRNSSYPWSDFKGGGQNGRRTAATGPRARDSLRDSGLPGTGGLVRPCGRRRQARQHFGQPAADSRAAEDRSRVLRQVHQQERKKPLRQLYRAGADDAKPRRAVREVVSERTDGRSAAIQSRLNPPQIKNSLLMVERPAFAYLKFGISGKR